MFPARKPLLCLVDGACSGAWNEAGASVLEKAIHPSKTTGPMERFCCYHCARMMSNRNLNSTEKAMGILRILYPDADEYALERNLYFPLKRCLQIQPDICAGFPDCMRAGRAGAVGHRPGQRPCCAPGDLWGPRPVLIHGLDRPFLGDHPS